ncbi:HesA/MoeB/ThiF family protein [Marinitoga sp. 1138]|uniref:HesA/MoeB/ThiF family protein n=1 Tax=Marinitoga sp. 1138 TaxID=1643334 RepID=UPI001585E173|nr:HesA/MoeB/ThiF family protein [Marinitoga sp. 1138]NUU98217.1 hypothetical protein [Marinitoga sp. 1138]
MRYNRHEFLFGRDFEKIRNSSIMVCGAGGLGSNVLMQISRLGVKKIHIYDNGILDEPDLNRQILYDIEDIGKKKVIAAKEKLEKINPEVKYYIYDEKITEDTKFPDVDIIIDCLDNFEGRKIIDKRAFEKNIPYIHGGVEGYYGQITDIIPGKTKRLFEIFGDIEDTGETKYVVPYAVSIIASIQVSEAIKIITGDYENALINKLMIMDLKYNTFDIIEIN